MSAFAWTREKATPVPGRGLVDLVSERLGRAVRGTAPALRVALRENATAQFRPGRRGLTLRSERGTLLVTQAGDPTDHVVEPSAEFRTSRRGLVVAWALGEAVLAVSADAPAAPARAA